MVSTTLPRCFELLSELTHDHFAKELGSPFLLQHGGVSIELELAEVTQLAPAGVGSRRIPFSLIFHAPRQPMLPQKIYPLENDLLGRLEIFLVPLGPQGENMRYEAIFT